MISNMDNLKSIWPNQLTQNSFCKLKKMEITSCDQLLNVFPSHVLNKLQSIELWLQPPLEAMVLILLMAQSTGASSFLPSLSVCRGNAVVKFCFDISTEFIHAINLFLGDCMDQM